MMYEIFIKLNIIVEVYSEHEMLILIYSVKNCMIRQLCETSIKLNMIVEVYSIQSRIFFKTFLIGHKLILF